MVRLRDIDWHCVKSVGIRSYSGSYFPAFGLSMERYRVSLHSVQMRENADQNNSEYGHLFRQCGATIFEGKRLESYFKILFIFLQKQFHFALTIH